MTYKDPTLDAVIWNEELNLREYGCCRCAMREEVIDDGYLCRIGREPGRRGYCVKWQLDVIKGD